MGGMFIDTFAIYVYKSLCRLFDLLGSNRWERAVGHVLDYFVADSPVGCTLLTVKYQIESADGSWVATEEIPFLASRDAERYARGLTAKPEVKVRISPRNKGLTHLFARDQEDI